ncbi:hypothetical protein DIPPA_03338 [Diplonema papillatum]|nr:hypothetical protein DIPPA_03338 [Diplonema papillatum]|eukprot:gene15974-24442_t
MPGNKRRIAALVAAVVCILFLGRNYLTTDNVRRHRAGIENFVATHPISSPLVFCCVLSAVLACSLPGEILLTAMCGIVLSPWLVAVVTAWVAHIIGGVINFSILRAAWYGEFPPLFAKQQLPTLPLTTPQFEEPVSPRSREWLSWMDRKVRGAPAWLLIVLRLFPPLFAPLNAAMAVGDVPLQTYIWTTAAGTLPSQVILTLFARQVADSLLQPVPSTPSPPSLFRDEEDDSQIMSVAASNSLSVYLLSPSGFLPPRIRPWAVPVVVPVVWFSFLFIAGFAVQRLQLPASRMWRRHPLPHRSPHGVII